MPTPTHTLIEAVTLATSASSVTFSSISSTGKGDLVVVADFNTTTSNGDVFLKFNNSSSGYNYVSMEGNGSTSESYSFSNLSNFSFTYSNTTSGAKSNFIVNLLDYSANKHKSMLARWNDPNREAGAYAIRWASNAAINRLDVTTNSSFAAGSTFHLYQIVSE